MKAWTATALAALAWIAAPGVAHAQFTQEGGTYATGDEPYGVYAADFDGDQRPDLATVNGTSSDVSIFLRQPLGGFAEEAGSPISVIPGSGPSYGAVGDFNRDGRPDLAVGTFVNSRVAILIRSTLGFAQEAGVQTSGRVSAVGAGDFDRDGDVDLAVARWDIGNVTTFRRNPENTGFTETGSNATGVNPRQIAVADFDGDAWPDLAVANAGSGNVMILRNDQTGAFGQEAAGIPVGAGPSGIVAGDFDGDGRQDFAVTNQATDTVSIKLRNAANTGFDDAPGSPVAVSDAPVGLAVADFDANGTPDIAVAANGGALDVIRRGGSAFARDTTTSVAGAPNGVAVADFNGDSRPDAAVSSFGPDLLSILLSPSPPAQPPPQPTPTPTPTPTLDNPQVNREVNVLPVSGTVRIKRAGSNRYVVLRAGEQIPNGSSVDARDGRVTIVAAQSGTRVERADFYDGLFRVSQTRRLTTLTLTEQLDCPRGARAAQSKPKSRKLWGDGKGKFRTKGRYAAATVRGTRWLVRDTCTSTKVTVRVGSVSVRDEVRKRTIIVRRGKSYTARARR